MRFSVATLFSVLSISFLSGAIARPLDESALVARSFSPSEVAEINFARGINEEREVASDLWARAKAPKVTFDLEKGKLNSKDRQLAEEQAEDALTKYGYKAGTVIYAYHLSNGETVEHITIEPVGGGKKIHAYRDGVSTQGEERRPE